MPVHSLAQVLTAFALYKITTRSSCSPSAHPTTSIPMGWKRVRENKHPNYKSLFDLCNDRSKAILTSSAQAERKTRTAFLCIRPCKNSKPRTKTLSSHAAHLPTPAGTCRASPKEGITGILLSALQVDHWVPITAWPKGTQEQPDSFPFKMFSLSKKAHDSAGTDFKHSAL